MGFLNGIKKIMADKLKSKLSQEEINDLTNKIIDDLSNRKYIQFLNERNELVLVDDEDILYVYEKSKNIYAFKTETEEFELLNKNVNLEFLLNENFYQLDKKVLVNLKRIKCYNSYMGTVYFSDDVDDNSLKLRVSIKAINEIVRSKVGKDKDLYCQSKENQVAYSPLSRRGV